GLGAPGNGLVRLAEVLTPLRVADEGAGDAVRLQHLRRDLAGERSLLFPVHVLRVCRQPGLDRRDETHERRADDDVDAADPRQPVGECLRIGPVIHLPVSGDQQEARSYVGIAATPGSSLPSSSSSAAAATTSTGSSTGKSSGFSSRSCSAILPPISTVSAVSPRFCRTPSLSSTFAPPETRTKGWSMSPSSLPRWSSSSSSSRPAYAGSTCATPS